MTTQLQSRSVFEKTGLRLTTKNLSIIPVILLTVILVILVVTVVNLIGALNNQVELGEAALNLQLAEQGQSFAQLQRETLRLMPFVYTSPQNLDREAAQLQIDLLASRVFQIGTIANQPTTTAQQAEVSRALTARSDEIVRIARLWLQNPEDAVLRDTLIGQMGELDRDVNLDIIEFGRVRVQSVIAFRDATAQAQTAFAIAGFAFVLLMLMVLANIYLYLRQAQETEAARQTIRFKDQFLAVMSHELRTPLNAIIGFLGIMKMQGADSAKFPHMIDRSRVNAERLLNLIDDILDISKIEAGRFEIHPEAVVVNEVVNRWKAQVETQALQKGLEFECIVDDTLPRSILIDADAVSKVTMNLLSNALKFTEKGALKLEIKNLGSQWQIRVTDTGIGIPQDKHEIIFESFRQVDGSIRRNFGGSGLGLSIVKQLTGLMGGRVVVESQEGNGSVFTVNLPLALPPAAPDLDSASAVRAPHVHSLGRG